MSISRLPRVRPLLRFESSLFFNSKMGPPQRRMAFVGKRRCQATGGIFCLQEMERCGLCVDENQGGTTVNFIVLAFARAIFYLRRKRK